MEEKIKIITDSDPRGPKHTVLTDPEHWFFVWTLAYEDDRDEQGFPSEPDGEGQAVHHQVQLERCQEEEPEMLEHLRKKIPTREYVSIIYAKTMQGNVKINIPGTEKCTTETWIIWKSGIMPSEVSFSSLDWN